MPVSKATIEEIAWSMKDAKDDGKPFAVLLGAGASRSAGIPTASEMADELAIGFYKREEGQDPPDDLEELWEWAAQSSWYKDREQAWKKKFPNVDESFCRYAACMAELKGARRQRYLLECCQRATAPNWAHLFVAQLIAEDYVDIVLTTNFDDLMRRALLLFPGALPVLCEHAQTANYVLLDMPRPQIVHLHGSAIHYDTSHTPDDVQQLRGNFEHVVTSVLQNRGLLVVGYRGAEPGVMGALQDQLGYFPPPYRLYWIAHGKSEEHLTEATRELLALHPGEHLAMLGQDADEFFARLCGPEGLGLDVPNFINNPFAHGLAALEGVAEMPADAGDETSGLVSAAQQRLEKASQDLSGEEARQLFFEAVGLQRKGDESSLLAAGDKYRQALEIKPDYHEALYNWGNALADLARLVAEEDAEAARQYYEQAGEKYQQAADIKPDDAEALYNWGNALAGLAGLVAEEDPEAARQYYEQAGEKCQQALDIKPDDAEALNNWGGALAGLARLVAEEDPEAAREYYQQAGEKCQQALDIKPDLHEVLYNWGGALAHLARLVAEEDAEAARQY